MSKSIGGEAVDLGVRTVYRVAHRVLRAWWAIRRPSTHGALIAVWHSGRLLIVKNSYRREHTLPGGYIRDGETPAGAGARELEEEVGISLRARDLKPAYTEVKPFENRDDRVTILEVEVDERPTIGVDNREVVWAGFKAPEEITRMRVVPHVLEYLRRRSP